MMEEKKGPVRTSNQAGPRRGETWEGDVGLAGTGCGRNPKKKKKQYKTRRTSKMRAEEFRKGKIDGKGENHEITQQKKTKLKLEKKKKMD